jgi:hypothetical protein
MSTETIPTVPIEGARVFSRRRLSPERLEALAEEYDGYRHARLLVDAIDAGLSLELGFALAAEGVDVVGLELLVEGKTPDSPFGVDGSVGLTALWFLTESVSPFDNPFVYLFASQGPNGPQRIGPTPNGVTEGSVFVGHFGGQDEGIQPEEWCKSVVAAKSIGQGSSGELLYGELLTHTAPGGTLLVGLWEGWYLYANRISVRETDVVTVAYDDVRYQHFDWLLDALDLRESVRGEEAGVPTHRRFTVTGFESVPQWSAGPRVGPRIDEFVLSQRQDELPEVPDTGTLKRARLGLQEAQTEPELEAYREFRDVLYDRTLVPEIKSRPSFYSSITEQQLELVIKAYETTGVRPDLSLAIWIQESGGRLSSAVGAWGSEKNRMYGGKPVSMVDESHARAAARSYYLWEVYGLDIAGAIIPKGETLARFGVQLNDSEVDYAASQNEHDSRLRELIDSGSLRQNIDIVQGLNQGLKVTDSGSKWRVTTRPSFDEYAVILKSLDIGVRASKARPETREILGFEESDPVELPPEMTRLAYVGGHGGLNTALKEANEEVKRWKNEEPLRREAKNWAEKVMKLNEELFGDSPAALGETALEIASIESGLKDLVFFLGTEAGKRVFPSGTNIPETVKSDPNSEAARQEWPGLLSVWRPVAKDIVNDSALWGGADLGRADKWIGATRPETTSNEPWQELMRPITQVSSGYRKSVIKYILFQYQTRQIFKHLEYGN